jgi:hypothetical protein
LRSVSRPGSAFLCEYGGNPEGASGETSFSLCFVFVVCVLYLLCVFWLSNISCVTAGSTIFPFLSHIRHASGRLGWLCQQPRGGAQCPSHDSLSIKRCNLAINSRDDYFSPSSSFVVCLFAFGACALSVSWGSQAVQGRLKVHLPTSPLGNSTNGRGRGLIFVNSSGNH